MTLTFFLMARLRFFLLIKHWKRSRSLRLARVALLASFYAMGVAAHFLASSAFFAAFRKVPVRAPR